MALALLPYACESFLVAARKLSIEAGHIHPRTLTAVLVVSTITEVVLKHTSLVTKSLVLRVVLRTYLRSQKSWSFLLLMVLVLLTTPALKNNLSAAHPPLLWSPRSLTRRRGWGQLLHTPWSYLLNPGCNLTRCLTGIPPPTPLTTWDTQLRSPSINMPLALGTT